MNNLIMFFGYITILVNVYLVYKLNPTIYTLLYSTATILISTAFIVQLSGK
jgi:hypothetical protein